MQNLVPLVTSYNLALVILSVVLSTLAAYVAVELASRVTAASGTARYVWLSGGACALGVGIWAMHYVGMLALMVPFDVAYHVPTVLFSLLAAIAASWIALSAVSSARLGPLKVVVASITMGAGIATMHYVGMAAMRMPASCHWNLSLIALSVVLAVVISATAILLIFQLKEERRGMRKRKIAGVLLMGLAIPVMHYTGMAAVHFSSSVAVPDLNNSVSVSVIGVSVVGISSLLVLGLALVMAIVDRRLSAQAILLQASEIRNRQLVESVQAVLWQRNVASMQFTFVNKQAETLLGFPTSEWLADNEFLEKHSHPDDQALVRLHCQQAVEERKPVEMEHRFITASGGILWLRTYLQSVTLSEGSLELTGVAHDVSATKDLQTELIEQRLYFDTLMNTTADYIYFKDKESRFIQINRSMAVNLFRLNGPADAVGKSDRDFFGETHSRQALETEEMVMRTGQPLLNLEEREDWPDGRVTWASTSKMPLSASDGEIWGTFGISRDMTQRKNDELALIEKSAQMAALNANLKQQMEERKNLESQLLQAQKLESIGQLAAGVAHEINTPVQYVGDNCRFLSESFASLNDVLLKYNDFLESVKPSLLPSAQVESLERTIKSADLDFLSEEIPRALDQSLEGIERVAQIVRAMKDFAHPGSADKSPADINKAIENTLAVCRNEYKYVANVRTDFDLNLPQVYCLGGEINQVVLNLVVNAAHAVDDAHREAANGLICITTRQIGEDVEVRVSDNGTGIPSHVQDRIFDPFFTTKEVGKGSGQGLALARNVVVKKHGGTLTFETTKDEGTTFILRIPISGQTPAAQAPSTQKQTEVTLDEAQLLGQG